MGYNAGPTNWKRWPTDGMNAGMGLKCSLSLLYQFRNKWTKIAPSSKTVAYAVSSFQLQFKESKLVITINSFQCEWEKCKQQEVNDFLKIVILYEQSDDSRWL